MSLQFGKAEFGLLEKQQKTPFTRIESSVDDVETNFNKPQILSEEETIDCFGYLPVAQDL